MKSSIFVFKHVECIKIFFQNILRAFFEVEKIDKIAFFGFWVENLHQFSIEYQQFLLF